MIEKVANCSLAPAFGILVYMKNKTENVDFQSRLSSFGSLSQFRLSVLIYFLFIHISNPSKPSIYIYAKLPNIYIYIYIYIYICHIYICTTYIYVPHIYICVPHIYMCHIEAKSFVNFYGGARGVMVIVVGNGHGDLSSNPGRE